MCFFAQKILLELWNSTTIIPKILSRTSSVLLKPRNGQDRTELKTLLFRLGLESHRWSGRIIPEEIILATFGYEISGFHIRCGRCGKEKNLALTGIDLRSSNYYGSYSGFKFITSRSCGVNFIFREWSFLWTHKNRSPFISWKYNCEGRDIEEDGVGKWGYSGETMYMETRKIKCKLRMKSGGGRGGGEE